MGVLGLWGVLGFVRFWDLWGFGVWGLGVLGLWVKGLWLNKLIGRYVGLGSRSSGFSGLGFGGFRHKAGDAVSEMERGVPIMHRFQQIP